MTKGGPFDAAIKYLRNGKTWGWLPELRNSCQAAIRVLETAGKVDGGDLLASFENICCEARVTGPSVDAIRRILAALPTPTEDSDD